MGATVYEIAWGVCSIPPLVKGVGTKRVKEGLRNDTGCFGKTEFLKVHMF